MNAGGSTDHGDVIAFRDVSCSANEVAMSDARDCQHVSEVGQTQPALVTLKATGLTEPSVAGEPNLVSKEALAAQAVLLKKISGDQQSTLLVLDQDLSGQV